MHAPTPESAVNRGVLLGRNAPRLRELPDFSEAHGSTLAYAGADSKSGVSSAVDSGRLFALLVGKGEGGGSEVMAAAARAAAAAAAAGAAAAAAARTAGRRRRRRE